MTAKCIDISHWQGFPRFDEVRAAGVVACIMKATEGASYIDPNRATNYIAATKAGIACCTYHWLKPGDAADQMRFYLDVVDPQPGERMVIDYEEDGCTLADLHEAVDFLKSDPRGLQVTVYSGHLLKEQLNGDCDEFLAANTDLWLAQYADADNISWSTGTYPQWTLWQYSETGSVSGIDGGAVDLDKFNGSDADLVAWISPAGKQPGPVLIPISIAITLPDDAAITISINGDIVYGEQL